MVSIPLSDDQFQKLNERAQAAGYADLPAMLHAFANESSEDPRGELTDEELSQSIAELEQADAQIDAGEGVEAEETFRSIAAKHGFKPPG